MVRRKLLIRETPNICGKIPAIGISLKILSQKSLAQVQISQPIFATNDGSLYPPFAELRTRMRPFRGASRFGAANRL
jgi:hypothetical protein